MPRDLTNARSVQLLILWSKGEDLRRSAVQSLKSWRLQSLVGGRGVADGLLFETTGSLFRVHLCRGCIMTTMASAGQQSDSLNIQLLVDSIPALIHTARPNGYLDYFNKRWLEYLGVTLVKVAGWNWTVFVHPEDVGGILTKWRDCLTTGEIFQYETRVRRTNGEYRWMFHRKVPLRDANGDIVKWYGSSLDIEERRTAEEQLRRNTEELRRSEFYLAEGQRLAHMGSWVFEPADFFDYLNSRNPLPTGEFGPLPESAER